MRCMLDVFAGESSEETASGFEGVEAYLLGQGGDGGTVAGAGWSVSPSVAVIKSSRAVSAARCSPGVATRTKGLRASARPALTWVMRRRPPWEMTGAGSGTGSVGAAVVIQSERGRPPGGCCPSKGVTTSRHGRSALPVCNEAEQLIRVLPGVSRAFVIAAGGTVGSSRVRFRCAGGRRRGGGASAEEPVGLRSQHPRMCWALPVARWRCPPV